MQNVHSAGRVPYEAAPRLRGLTFSEKLKLFLEVCVEVITVLGLSVPIFFRLLKEFFIRPPPKNIAGQIALITGGGNGIGRAIALKLAEEGCTIIIADIDAHAAKKTELDVKVFKVNAYAFGIDVANYKKLIELREQIENDIGRVDILVNSAGLMPLLSLREGPEEDINRITDVNINANFWTVRTFLPSMMERKRGHIVSISSMSALHPMGGATIYTATKFAHAGFTRALEQELRQEGYGEDIHFTCVYPYFVSTRRDLMEAVNLRFPAITAQETAEAVVNGIKQNRREVVVPSVFSCLTKILRSLPFDMQNLVRDYILKEKESRMLKIPEEFLTGNFISALQTEQLFPVVVDDINGKEEPEHENGYTPKTRYDYKEDSVVLRFDVCQQ